MRPDLSQLWVTLYLDQLGAESTRLSGGIWKSAWRCFPEIIVHEINIAVATSCPKMALKGYLTISHCAFNVLRDRCWVAHLQLDMCGVIFKATTSICIFSLQNIEIWCLKQGMVSFGPALLRLPVQLFSQSQWSTRVHVPRAGASRQHPEASVEDLTSGFQTHKPSVARGAHALTYQNNQELQLLAKRIYIKKKRKEDDSETIHFFMIHDRIVRRLWDHRKLFWLSSVVQWLELSSHFLGLRFVHVLLVLVYFGVLPEFRNQAGGVVGVSCPRSVWP